MNCKLLSIVALGAVVMGCRTQPFQTVMRGAMSMDGDMRMEGDMNMSGEVSTVMRTDNTASRLMSVPVYARQQQMKAPRVCVVDVDGLLVNKNLSGMGSFGENPVALFREKLDCIATDPSVAAIVLRINSTGGGVTAADMMSRDLAQIRAQSNVPIVACVMDVGAGGAYYLASGADAIVAHPTSLVGGIGVILNVYNMEDSMGQFGVVSIPIKSGDRIDIASPERMMEEDERDLLQGIADEFHQRFIDRVNSSRKHPIAKELADGRVITGEQALVAGLVDQVGYLDDAIVLARQLARLPQDAPIVMLRRDNDRAYTLFDVTPNTPTMSSILPLKMPGIERSSLPTYLYLWQPEPSHITSSGA